MPLLEQLLANVWLFADVSLMPKTENTAATFISQDGKFAQKANFLRGGAALAFEGKKIGRQKNLELMAEQLQTLAAAVETDKKELAQLQQQLHALRQIDHKKNIQQLEQQISQYQRQQLIAKSKIDNFQQQQEQQDEDSQRQEQLLRIYRREQIERNTLLQEQTQKATQAAQYLQQEQQRIQQNKEQLSARSQSANQKNIEVLRQQNTLATLEKDISFARQQIQDIAQRVAQGQETTSTAAQEVIETEKQIAEIQMLLQEMYEKKTLYQQQVELSEKEFFVHRGNINAQEEELQQLNRQYQNSLQLINQLQNNFSQTKVQLSTLAERIRIEFEININDVVNQDPDRELFEPADLDERVQKLRQKLQNYGAVNYMAIEAYDETKTRFDFISEQRADLIKAKELLLETLREIEAAATELFMVAFTTVRTHFISVFRSLFDADDTCDLLLSNPTSPLESRIEIVAKPKGKKPLSINQLSGGEKTLTATALLFALYLLKPAPFCIFDEVDAPLDDANIAKFNNIIRDFSKNSQFIVVTHNKKTMESVNIMYGVTMVEGVSRVVPVDFRAFA
jgi:chromosome segregation protein